MQVGRALALAIHTFVTVIPGLQDPRVIALNGKNLLIAVLFFSALDVLIATVRAWPKKFWVFWDVRELDQVFAFIYPRSRDLATFGA